MADYQKMSNQEVLVLQTALGSFKPGIWLKGDEIILLSAGGLFLWEEAWVFADPFFAALFFLLAIGLMLYRYNIYITAPKRAMRKDLIQLEKEVITARIQYKAIDVKTELHYLYPSGIDYPVIVNPQIYHQLQAGEHIEFSLSRHSKVFLAYTKVLIPANAVVGPSN